MANKTESVRGRCRRCFITFGKKEFPFCVIKEWQDGRKHRKTATVTKVWNCRSRWCQRKELWSDLYLAFLTADSLTCRSRKSTGVINNINLWQVKMSDVAKKVNKTDVSQSYISHFTVLHFLIYINNKIDTHLFLIGCRSSVKIVLQDTANVVPVKSLTH